MFLSPNVQLCNSIQCNLYLDNLFRLYSVHLYHNMIVIDHDKLWKYSMAMLLNQSTVKFGKSIIRYQLE